MFVSLPFTSTRFLSEDVARVFLSVLKKNLHHFYLSTIYIYIKKNNSNHVFSEILQSVILKM